ncbi:MAG: SRPBCC family protein [Actinobacteria bacterium]|nr:SRPBCC family protein [Actinomycetota bacterium]
MKIQNSFDVVGEPGDVMRMLLDAEQVVPCMPGAQLVEIVDDNVWLTKMRVKLGPVGMDFDNRVQIESIDEAAGTARMLISGRDSRGKGGAEGSVDAVFEAIDGGQTRVTMDTDLRFSGQAAQLGRPNVVQDVAGKMVDQFAACLGSRMALSVPAGGDQGAAEAPPPPPSAKPISGFSILLAAIVGVIKRLFRRPTDS